MKLNNTQSRLLDILRVRESSYTLDELASILNLSNKSSVHYNIKKLIQGGYLKVNPSNSSDYIVLDKQDTGLYYLPLYSGAKCGPNGTLISDYNDTEIPIASRIFNFDVGNAIAMKTEGDSMEPRIPERSIILVDKRDKTIEAHKAFLVIHKNMPLVKDISYDEFRDCYILTSYNLKYAPIIASKEDVSIVGKVKAIISNI